MRERREREGEHFELCHAEHDRFDEGEAHRGRALDWVLGVGDRVVERRKHSLGSDRVDEPLSCVLHVCCKKHALKSELGKRAPHAGDCGVDVACKDGAEVHPEGAGVRPVREVRTDKSTHRGRGLEELRGKTLRHKPHGRPEERLERGGQMRVRLHVANGVQVAAHRRDCAASEQRIAQRLMASEREQALPRVHGVRLDRRALAAPDVPRALAAGHGRRQRGAIERCRVVLQEHSLGAPQRSEREQLFDVPHLPAVVPHDEEPSLERHAEHQGRDHGEQVVAQPLRVAAEHKHRRVRALGVEFVVPCPEPARHLPRGSDDRIIRIMGR
eukprot:Amastigsp_a510086_10.p2 type:complete len:328 gc:universal Amastigsp_a510086_10:1224-241(-)